MCAAKVGGLAAWQLQDCHELSSEAVPGGPKDHIDMRILHFCAQAHHKGILEAMVWRNPISHIHAIYSIPNTITSRIQNGLRRFLGPGSVEALAAHPWANIAGMSYHPSSQ